MHAMLAYGDIDLVLAMNADTNINATIAINADADTDVIAINTGSITSPPDATPRHDSGQSSSGTPVQPASNCGPPKPGNAGPKRASCGRVLSNTHPTGAKYRCRALHRASHSIPLFYS